MRLDASSTRGNSFSGSPVSLRNPCKSFNTSTALVFSPISTNFSATGTTERVAKQIAAETGGELYEIVPAQPYTAADLDWNDRQSRSSVEMNDPKSRPALKVGKADIGSYDVIYLGYPIWWGVAPRIINTFIEANGLKGKRVMPFATSGGSGIEQSVEELKAAYPEIDWGEGKMY